MMRKKIVDILPPKSLEEKEEKEIFEEMEVKIRAPRIRITAPIPPFKKVAISISALFFLAAVFCFFTLSKANIEVWPETDTINLTTKLTIDASTEEYNFVTKVIPGQVFEKEKMVTENFPATGTFLKEEKAKGTIRVYNEYSSSPQALLATTRFVSADGKLFRTPTKVTIPGGTYDKGKLVPGEIDVNVVADQPGPDYNIGATTFSIPGFAGSDRYTKLYAKSFKAMEGGSREQSSRVTEEDLTKAKNSVMGKAETECENLLKEELQTGASSPEYIFLENALQTETMETFSLVKVGDEAENFNYQAKAKSKTLIFKKEDFENFAKDFIFSQLPEGREFYEESLEIKSKPETTNLDSGKIILSLEISGKSYANVDISNLKQGLREKSLLESKIFLENQPHIIKAKVELWPFWVRKVPEDLNKINLKLRID